LKTERKTRNNERRGGKMRILKNKTKVYGFDELNQIAKNKAIQYIENRKKEYLMMGKSYYFTVNDFEWFKNGQVMFHTNNIDAY
jgi:hypothetical protein